MRRSPDKQARREGAAAHRRLTRPSAAGIRRAILLAVPAALVLAATPTLAAFTATITGSGHTTAASMVLTSTPCGSSTCTSTSGTNTPFTSDSATCTSFPGGGLTAGYEATLPVALASAGTVGPSTASLASGATGLQTAPDVSGFGDDAFAVGGVTFNASGPLSGERGQFRRIDRDARDAAAVYAPPPGNITLSAWVKVASGYSSGGGIIGSRECPERLEHADVAGRRWSGWTTPATSRAGEYNGSTEEIATSLRHLQRRQLALRRRVVQLDHGLTLYVDGSSVATNSATTVESTSYAALLDDRLRLRLDRTRRPRPATTWTARSPRSRCSTRRSPRPQVTHALQQRRRQRGELRDARAGRQPAASSGRCSPPSSTTNLPDDRHVAGHLGQQQRSPRRRVGVTPSDAGPFTDDGAMYFDGATDGTQPGRDGDQTTPRCRRASRSQRGSRRRAV